MGIKNNPGTKNGKYVREKKWTKQEKVVDTLCSCLHRYAQIATLTPLDHSSVYAADSASLSRLEEAINNSTKEHL